MAIWNRLIPALKPAIKLQNHAIPAQNPPLPAPKEANPNVGDDVRSLKYNGAEEFDGGEIPSVPYPLTSFLSLGERRTVLRLRERMMGCW